MNNLSKKDLVLVSLMLFSLFFGAGNLIFPPFLGQSAGSSTWITILGFFITSVGFPILGVVAVAKSSGLHKLAGRVHPVFATVFTILIYLSIGPGLGIPRAGSLPFEMAVRPFLPERFISHELALFIYTFLFFSVAYWLSLTPSKLVDRMGKILTPALLVLISTIFVASLFNPIGSYSKATGNYVDSPFISGFLDGYMTMDTIAALNFGIVISLVIKSKGIKEENDVVKNSVKAGMIAGGLLIVIYSMLAHLGACSGSTFEKTENGAQTLANVMLHLFGNGGAVLLAILFTLACLTTCVGLITSCSQYFVTLNSKISYKTFVRVLSLSSMTLANMGLTKILKVSVPVLDAIYPVAIVLILLAMFDKLFKENQLVYRASIAFTSFVSIIYALSNTALNIPFLTKLVSWLPFYDKGLGWILPATFGIFLGLVLKSFKEKVYKLKLAKQRI
ncbi:branched-chain amino acid transport system II carrier protein [Romboutsia maritimum]|uniref:Branched-chain amino acid transport system carrier protein n=1 Tax=Romboutsia maritimum TaxID=2020948 RepID=A0A371IRL1_9FIRM|nr:branched-chain amino acid transport system II carrier protein [Romboutsia maritimum]RDY23103.1 branched-chain amino acid transport system II carrier protein [Romboutsia maritimum]